MHLCCIKAVKTSCDCTAHPFLDLQKSVNTLRWRKKTEWYNLFQAEFGSYGWYPLTQPPRKKTFRYTYFIAQSFCPQALSKPAANVDTIPQDDDSDDEVLENAPVAEVPAVATRGVLQRFKDMMGRSKDRWGMWMIWRVEIEDGPPKRWVLINNMASRDLRSVFSRLPGRTARVPNPKDERGWTQRDKSHGPDRGRWCWKETGAKWVTFWLLTDEYVPSWMVCSLDRWFYDQTSCRCIDCWLACSQLPLVASIKPHTYLHMFYCHCYVVWVQHEEFHQFLWVEAEMTRWHSTCRNMEET